MRHTGHDESSARSRCQLCLVDGATYDMDMARTCLLEVDQITLGEFGQRGEEAVYSSAGSRSGSATSEDEQRTL